MWNNTSRSMANHERMGKMSSLHDRPTVCLLESRTLPGYFIEECNLMDSIELQQALFNEIRKLRRNPITSAATFLDSTRCFRHSHFKISDHIQDFCGFDLIEKIILRKQLIFLQKMTIEMNSIMGVTLWKKEAVLRIFAKWCHQNSHEIHLAPWQCLTTKMILFDVVHMDIVHEFEVPDNISLGFVDREWSAEVVCKLACCYSMTHRKRGRSQEQGWIFTPFQNAPHDSSGYQLQTPDIRKHYTFGVNIDPM